MELRKYKLSQLLSIKNGKDYKHLDNGDVPVFGSGGFMCSVNSYLYDKVSILLPRKGTLSNIQFYNNGRFWTVDTCFYSIVNESLCDPYYLYRYIKSLDLSGYDTGASIPSMTQKTYNGIKVSLPSLPTQHRIASILSAYDNLIENNNKRIRLLEQMAENLYKEWFVRFRFPGHEKVEMENGLPKGWKVERLKAIVKRLPFNRTYKEEELEKAGKVVVIDQSTNDVLGYHNNEPSHYADYNNPLIIFGDHSCKFQLMTQNFSLGENVIPFTTCDNSVVNEYWLFYATHKLIKTEEYKRHWGRFSSMKVLIPKIGLQNKFADIIVSLEKDKNKLKAENDNLTRQRDLLLPRLMSGKLEVK